MEISKAFISTLTTVLITSCKQPIPWSEVDILTSSLLCGNLSQAQCYRLQTSSIRRKGVPKMDFLEMMVETAHHEVALAIFNATHFHINPTSALYLGFLVAHGAAIFCGVRTMLFPSDTTEGQRLVRFGLVAVAKRKW